mmetsp:Transcript_54881/g.91072  ORF Transcript_54881/g.91072 Transcript_54881/m.91072 type:complete len:244 (+) Transcript_54881:2326-3057(+)
MIDLLDNVLLHHLHRRRGQSLRDRFGVHTPQSRHMIQKLLRLWLNRCKTITFLLELHIAQIENTTRYIPQIVLNAAINAHQFERFCQLIVTFDIVDARHFHWTTLVRIHPLLRMHDTKFLVVSLVDTVIQEVRNMIVSLIVGLKHDTRFLQQIRLQVTAQNATFARLLWNIIQQLGKLSKTRRVVVEHCLGIAVRLQNWRRRNNLLFHDRLLHIGRRRSHRQISHQQFGRLRFSSTRLATHDH